VTPRLVLDTPGALVVAADLGAGGPAADVADWLETAKQDLELLRLDLALFGRYEIRDGRRVPPEDWARIFPPISTGVSLDFTPPPLSFIGRAANEGA